MKKVEQLSTSEEDKSVKNCENYKISDDKVISLLNLVYYQRKSIRQTSKYLKINYNSAKRIVKNFRKNKLYMNKKKIDQNTFMTYLIKHNSDENKLATFHKENPLTEEATFNNLTSQIKAMSNQLISTHDEIKQNQKTLRFLLEYTNRIIEYTSKNTPTIPNINFN